MFRINVNGESHQVDEGASLLSALYAIGVEIPSLCHDPRMKAYGGCRLCVVRVEGRPRPVTACDTLVEDGMSVETHTLEVEQWRKSLIRLLVRQYPADAVARFPDKEFHRLVRAYGLENECVGTASPELADDSNPYIHADMSQCIYCYRCVRICEELQGQFVWQVWNRGDASRIRPDSGTTLRASSCVSCGACVDACPTGALEDKSVLAFGVPTEWTKTTCAYCGTGCEMNVGVRDHRVVEIKPVLDAPVNHGHLCVKGRYAFDFLYAGDRVTEPMIRRNSRWEQVSWDAAISFTAEGLQRILDRDGPESIGVLGSARATNEENYLAQKFARAVLGTNNVDCCARVCHAPTAAAMKLALGTGAATNSFDDIEQAQTILLCGANATENHPIIGARIKQAALRGAHLIVIDPRRIELVNYAECHLPLRPGTNAPLLNAMACAIVDENLYDKDYAQDNISNLSEFRDFVQAWSPETVAPVCGVNAQTIRLAARLYATAKPAMSIHGLGMTEHIRGTEAVTCLVNLALLTGNIGKPGTGINPLRGQNNVQGAAHMGCDPDYLTGSVSLEQGAELFEEVWKVPPPVLKGLNLLGMMDSAEAGELKSVWAIGYDILLTNANTHATRRALQAMELVIVQDMFLNETARECGSVFLPAASSFEKDGTFMNAERRVQRVRKAIDPIGGSKPDWEIICQLAQAMGKGDQFDYHRPEDVWNEIRRVWPLGRGITYERLEHAGLQWPCPAEDHPGTRILHSDGFPADKRAALRQVGYCPTAETVSEDFPFLLITGRTLYQFNAGTMTSRTRNSELRTEDCLDICPRDAESLGLQDGECVRINSRYGKSILPVRIGNSVKTGELFATFHSPEHLLNSLTSFRRDVSTGTPEYKVTAVRIEKIG